MFKTCCFDGCNRSVEGDGLCSGHLQQQRDGRPLAPLRRGSRPHHICPFPGCGRDVRADGLCKSHYRQARQSRPLRPIKVFTGRGFINDKGYRILSAPGHPNAYGSRKAAIAEHVLVMSQMLGRPLRKGENVHHKNGIRDDNRPQNLVLWSTAQPAGQAVTDKLEFATDLIETYPQMLSAEQRQRIVRAIDAASAPASVLASG